jgi:crotonobetainyl-CoA:carnitine CoA-transferase CaiB-like acyl-CoA transferase
VQLSLTAPRLGAATVVGQHTAAVLGELGYDDAAIARLRDDGVVACA